MKTTAKVILFSLMLFLPIAAAIACDFSFQLKEESGAVRSVTPGKEIALEAGRTYTLIVKYVEDHRNCTLAADKTVFLLEEEKWKTGKDNLPLPLLSPVSWKDAAVRTHVAELVFQARDKGDWILQVIRECDRGGYDETLKLSVS